MPLRQNIQLIVQVEDAPGHFTCEAYSGLPLTNPVLLAFAHVGSPTSKADMRRLAAAFLTELWGVAAGLPVDSPCGGAAAAGACHALREADCQKVLVVVGDDVTPLSPGHPMLRPWLSGDPAFVILPALPSTARTKIWSLLPPGVDEQNAAFWSRSVEEVLPAVFQTSAITAAQPKIFISYRQVDAAEAAIQLFDALSHARFDTFLDHFRIAPGVNFQSRLTQELGDKSMVLVLESEHLLDSEWVLYEINVAKSCGLGLFAVNFAGAPKVPGIDDDIRMNLKPADFVGGQAGGPLTADAVAKVTALARTQHDRALLRRRIALEQSFDEAVQRAGGAPPERQPNGAFRVAAPGKDYLTWLTTRPPELPDFHLVHGAAVKPTAGVIIGLTSLMEPPRVVRNEWLAGLCDLKIVDEGRLVWAAAEMARGAL
ncbi:MAG: hypothetical protein QOJ27_2777 [Sphingomonadales bacterium]|nr:hypothetical protein [Sphingomonadales bacterium]